MLSPLLFNVYLEETLKHSPLLQQMIERGDLVAYADDILLMANGKEELELALREFVKLEPHNLFLNLGKSQIMSNRQDMEGVSQVEGIKVGDKIKYLGIDIYCERKKTI